MTSSSWLQMPISLMPNQSKPSEDVTLRQAAKILRRETHRAHRDGTEIAEPQNEPTAALEAMLAASRRGKIVRGAK